MKQLILMHKKIILILVTVSIIAALTAVIILNNKNQSAVATIVNTKNDDAQIEDNDIIVAEYIGEDVIEDILVQEDENFDKEDEEESQNAINSDSKYYIKVNYQANVITIYQQGSDGEYTPIKAITCSTGRATPRSGVYSVQNKWTWGQLFGGVWGHYVTKIVGNILFHSVPYLSADPSSLEYWEYDKLGTACSAGCVRLTTADAQWIFNCMPSGTPIEFYGSSDPGPLGKPGTQKISWNEECRGWDPTDSNPDNPWRNYNQPEEQAETEQSAEEASKLENTNTESKPSNTESGKENDNNQQQSNNNQNNTENNNNNSSNNSNTGNDSQSGNNNESGNTENNQNENQNLNNGSNSGQENGEDEGTNNEQNTNESSAGE